jgi:UDP-N-acetylglucosamine--N-acetylmuramyl-(pentapeptide) pyrophosphoryl-undecaprenol N-acetylglucosamine transferase
MRCVIAGGGTGGHLFPGLAIAQAFVEREGGNEVLFVGTERGIETRVLEGGPFPLKTIEVTPFKGGTLMGKLKTLAILPRAVCQSVSILKRFRPQVVVGVGGYASGPALLGAYVLGIKRAIHEQNVVPGMTNRMLKALSQRIFVSFEETRDYFPKEKTWVTGLPVRAELLASLAKIQEKKRAAQKKSWFTLLVFGGSAGAHRINLAMMEALEPLEGMKSSLRIIHQTGREDLAFVSQGYRDKGFDALVRPFFEDMASCYEAADLVICRAGAGTIAELSICGKAAVLIPYPHAAHQHQLLNARKLMERGAARMIEDGVLNGALLAGEILTLYGQSEEREKMERAIQSMARPKAAQEIVDHCYALVQGKNRVRFEV